VIDDPDGCYGLVPYVNIHSKECPVTTGGKITGTFSAIDHGFTDKNIKSWNLVYSDNAVEIQCN
jgi:hypothetical protein